MSKKGLGIDFGTRSLKIYQKDEGVILNEKNVIAIEKNPYETPGVPYVENRRVKAGGNNAFEMMEKAPLNISVTYPMRNGVIAEYEHMLELLNYFMEKKFGSKSVKKNFAYMAAVPTNITDVEKRAFFDLLITFAGRKKNISIVEKPVAAAVGLNLDIIHSRGIMVVDAGADTTEVSIMSLGGIVISKLMMVGGSHFDDSIRQAVKRNYNLYIGDKTAENLKLKLSDAYPGRGRGYDDASEHVYGRNMLTGLPVKMEVEASMVREAMREQIYSIVDSVKTILERTPPEIANEIKDFGIYLTGGSAKIKNFDRLLAESTGLKVNCPRESENCVAEGLGKIMEYSSLSGLSYVPKSDKDVR